MLCLDVLVSCFFFSRYCDHRDLHVLTHSFPTRRSSDLFAFAVGAGDDQADLEAEKRFKGQGIYDLGCGESIGIPRTDIFGHHLGGACHCRSEDMDFGLGHLSLATPQATKAAQRHHRRSEEHTSELQSLMRLSYAVFCLKKKNNNIYIHTYKHSTTNTNALLI